MNPMKSYGLMLRNSEQQRIINVRTIFPMAEQHIIQNIIYLLITTESQLHLNTIIISINLYCYDYDYYLLQLHLTSRANQHELLTNIFLPLVNINIHFLLVRTHPLPSLLIMQLHQFVQL